MFFIRCTLLFANSFSYIPNKADMRFVVVLSFIKVCSTNLDRVSQIIPEPVDPTNLTQYLHALQLLTQQRKVEPLSIQIILDLHLPLTKICYRTFRFQSFNLLQKLFYLDPKNLELLVPVVKKKNTPTQQYRGSRWIVENFGNKGVKQSSTTQNLHDLATCLLKLSKYPCM